MNKRLASAAIAPLAAGSLFVAAVPAATAVFSASPAVAATVPTTNGISTVINTVAGPLTLTVNQIVQQAGQLVAQGTATLNGVTQNFSAPLQVTGTGSCQVLDLVLGPLHLDLLGLVIDLNQVHLNITAQQGPGNLLGNLLCAVANLLNGTGSGGGLAGLLNQINQILAGL